MKDFIITCSSTCDLTKDYLKKHNNYYVNFFYSYDSKKFKDDFYTEHSKNDFYNLIDSYDVKTSQPDPEQYKDLWIKLINDGKDILHIELSSGITGAYNSAVIARSLVLDIYKDAKIEIIDSLCCSTGYGLLLHKANQYKEINNDIIKVKNYVEELKLNINHIFILTNLDKLIKGGRINALAGNIGKLMNIVPIMHVDNQGKLELIKKIRGIPNAINEIINISKTNIINNENYSDALFLTTSANNELTKVLFDKSKENYKNADLSPEYIFNVGSVICSHTGTGALSIFYIGKGRV